MNPETLQQAAVLAKNIDTDADVLDADKFKFKHYDSINKSNLQIFKNEDLLYQDDAWGYWHWTEDAQTALKAVQAGPISEASDEQLTMLRRYSEALTTLPLNEEFYSRDYEDLIGVRLWSIQQAGFIEEVDKDGGVVVWKMTNFCVRIINSVAAQENRAGNFEARAVVADD